MKAFNLVDHYVKDFLDGSQVMCLYKEMGPDQRFGSAWSILYSNSPSIKVWDQDAINVLGFVIIRPDLKVEIHKFLKKIRPSLAFYHLDHAIDADGSYTSLVTTVDLMQDDPDEIGEALRGLTNLPWITKYKA